MATIKSLLLPIVLLGLMILFGVIILKPKFLSIIVLHGRIKKDKQILAKLTEKSAFLENLNEVELTAKGDLLLKALPPEKDVASTLLTLKFLSSKSGVTIGNLSIDPGEIGSPSSSLEKESFPYLPMGVKIESSKESFYSFLDAILDGLPLMSVDSIRISSSSLEAISADLNLRTYFMPLPSTLGLPESPLSPNLTQEIEILERLQSFKSSEEEIMMPVLQSGKENPFTY